MNQPEKRRHLLPITFRCIGETNVCVVFVRKHMRAKHAFTAAKRIPSERACLTSYTKKYSEKIVSRYGKVILQTTHCSSEIDVGDDHFLCLSLEVLTPPWSSKQIPHLDAQEMNVARNPACGVGV